MASDAQRSRSHRHTQGEVAIVDVTVLLDGFCVVATVGERRRRERVLSAALERKRAAVCDE